MILLYAVSALLLLSILLNILLILKRKKPVKKMDLDAKMLLRDIMNSGSLIHLRVVDPTEIYLKSPRDM